jgi:beta-glucosidase
VAVAPPDLPLAFRDPALPFAERVRDLLGRLTLEEKLALLHQHTPGVARLGLAPFHTGKEALHGAAWDGTATVFPQAVGLGATWDRELLAEIGEAVGREVRAQHDAHPLVSLVVWAPVVNLLRDPRWGRNEEGYSEDPLLTAELAAAYCRGLAGDHLPYLRVAPILKHFFAYNQEDDRTRTKVSVRPRVLHEYELPAFTGPLASGYAAGVMPSYNLVNGRPAHLAQEINAELRPVAPEELLVCSDAWAPSNIVDEQRYAPDHPSAHAWALQAGVDSFTDKDSVSAFTVANVRAALDQGLVTEGEVDRAAGRVLLARLRTGELDPDGGPFAHDGVGQLCSPAHAGLARRAVERSVVLLRNEAGVLPLASSGGDRLAVIGPLGDCLFHDWYSGTMPYQVTLAAGLREVTGAQVGVDAALDLVELRSDVDRGWLGEFAVCDWGYGALTLQDPLSRLYLSAKEDGSLVADQSEPSGWACREIFMLERSGNGTLVLRNRATGRYVAGLADRAGTPVEQAAPARPGRRSDDDRPRLYLVERAEAVPLQWTVLESGVPRAAELAKGARVAIVAAGNHPLINGRETEDRHGIELPEATRDLALAVAKACPRTVVVLMSSYPYALGGVALAAPGVLWTSHAGQEAGRAVAAVLTGKAEPGGRLAQTWYRSTSDLAPIGEYDVIKARRTYQYFEGEVLYPFGHGLSYTSFSYANASVSPDELQDRDPASLRFRVDVTNTGDRIGSEVVQLYARPPSGLPDRPRLRLCGFARAALQPGESRTVHIDVPASRLAFWDVRRRRLALDPGEHELLAGASSADVRCGVRVRVSAPLPRPRSLSGDGIAAADFDDYESIVVVDETPLAGTAISPAGAAGWALYREVELGAGGASPRQLWAKVACLSGSTRLEVRTGSPRQGRLVAATEVVATGGSGTWRYTWRELSLLLGPRTAGDGARRVEDLYVVLAGQLRLASLAVSPLAD